jgi:hypothetical protein
LDQKNHVRGPTVGVTAVTSLSDVATPLVGPKPRAID